MQQRLQKEINFNFILFCGKFRTTKLHCCSSYNNLVFQYQLASTDAYIHVGNVVQCGGISNKFSKRTIWRILVDLCFHDNTRVLKILCFNYIFVDLNFIYSHRHNMFGIVAIFHFWYSAYSSKWIKFYFPWKLHSILMITGGIDVK